jgi:hypothetical protein
MPNLSLQERQTTASSSHLQNLVIVMALAQPQVSPTL